MEHDYRDFQHVLSDTCKSYTRPPPAVTASSSTRGNAHPVEKCVYEVIPNAPGVSNITARGFNDTPPPLSVARRKEEHLHQSPSPCPPACPSLATDEHCLAGSPSPVRCTAPRAAPEFEGIGGGRGVEMGTSQHGQRRQGMAGAVCTRPCAPTPAYPPKTWASVNGPKWNREEGSGETRYEVQKKKTNTGHSRVRGVEIRKLAKKVRVAPKFPREETASPQVRTYRRLMSPSSWAFNRSATKRAQRSSRDASARMGHEQEGHHGVGAATNLLTSHREHARPASSRPDAGVSRTGRSSNASHFVAARPPAGRHGARGGAHRLPRYDIHSYGTPIVGIHTTTVPCETRLHRHENPGDRLIVLAIYASAPVKPPGLRR